MPESRAGSLSLVGGALALDFANTVSDRDALAPTEHFQAPRHLVDWAEHAGTIDATAARRLRGALACDGAAAERLLRHGLELRAVIQRIGAAIAHGQPPARADLGALKETARRQMAMAELAAANESYSFDFTEAPPEAALLGPVAWSAIDLLGRARLDRLKQCPGPGCGWLFLDTSKSGARRWCDMSSCGNRAKAARHRARKKAAEAMAGAGTTGPVPGQASSAGRTSVASRVIDSSS